MEKRWCKSNKLNFFMVFKYFSKKDVPLARVKDCHQLNAFCLCILTRFFWCVKHLVWILEFFVWSNA